MCTEIKEGVGLRRKLGSCYLKGGWTLREESREAAVSGRLQVQGEVRMQTWIFPVSNARASLCSQQKRRCSIPGVTANRVDTVLAILTVPAG